MGLGVYRGTAAVRGFFEDWIGSYELFEVELEECRDLGKGVVLNVVVQRARLAGSSGEVKTRYASIAVWEDALIVQRHELLRHRRGPCCRRTPRRGTG